MKRTLLLALAAALSAPVVGTPALAAENEINLELGTQGSNDEAWDVFSDRLSLPLFGLRVGVGLGDHLSLLAAYHRGSQGADVYAEDFEDGGDEPGEGFIAAYYGSSLAVGPKVSARLGGGWLNPYATAQIVGMMGTARIDEDPIDDGDATQQEVRGYTGAGLAAVGVELRAPFNDRSWTPATYAEVGYGHSLEMNLDDLGSMNFRGVHFRWGLGVRF
jgi:hypothetical protein